jgi:hypothetical protein
MPGLTCRRRDAALGGRQFQESEEEWKEARAESSCFGSNEAYRGYRPDTSSIHEDIKKFHRFLNCSLFTVYILFRMFYSEIGA